MWNGGHKPWSILAVSDHPSYQNRRVPSIRRRNAPDDLVDVAVAAGIVPRDIVSLGVLDQRIT